MKKYIAIIAAILLAACSTTKQSSLTEAHNSLDQETSLVADSHTHRVDTIFITKTVTETQKIFAETSADEWWDRTTMIWEDSIGKKYTEIREKGNKTSVSKQTTEIIATLQDSLAFYRQECRSWETVYNTLLKEYADSITARQEVKKTPKVVKPPNVLMNGILILNIVCIVLTIAIIYKARHKEKP